MTDTTLIWNAVGDFFTNVVFGSYILAGICLLGLIIFILVLAKTDWESILLFSIFVTFGLVTGGIFGDLISRSSYFLMLIYAGYRYFSYISKLTGHING